MSHSSHREGVEPYATLCPGNHPAYCQCDLIARVRKDERDAAIEAVWSVMEHSLSCYTTGEDCLRCEVTGAIEALGGEQ